MTTNKYSKFIVDNITVGTPISNIVAAGNNINELDGVSFDARIDGSMISYDSSTGNWVSTTNILADSGTLSADFFVGDGSNLTNVAVDGMLDSAEILDLMSYRVDEVGVNQKQISTSLNTFVSPFNQTGDDTRSWNLNYTSATGFYIREKGDSVGEGRTELVADASGSGLSTGLVLTGTSFAATGTEIAGNLKLAGLPTSDPAEAGLLWNDGGIPVFSGSTAPSGGAGIDSADVVSIVDAPYVQARQTPQDFAYSSLTGAPTALSSFTNDTNYITAADIPATVDSDYVAARAPAASGGLDSAGVTALINEPYLRDTLYDVATAQTNIGLDAGFASTSNFSIAIGKESGINSGNATNSIALGFKAGQSISDNSIMIGRETGEVGAGSYSVGIGTEALGIGAGAGSVAIGYFASKSSAGSNSVAVGRQASATGDNAIAIGNTVTATTADAVTIGSSVAGRVTYDTTNDWTFGATVNAPAFVGDGSGLTGLPAGGGLDSAGVQSVFDNQQSIRLGEGATTQNTSGEVAIGYLADATGADAIAIGYDANATALFTLSLGRGSNATYEDAIAIGRSATSSQADTIAMGTSSVASGSRSVAIGNGTDATGGSSVALGNSAQALATNAIAIGVSADTNVNADGIAIGSNTEVSGAQGISIGQTAEASQASVAIGSNASVTTGTESTAIGPFAGATGNASLALGRGAKANANNTIALAATGANSTVATQYGIDIRTSAAGSLTYDTTNDWTFGAGVTMTDLTSSGVVIFSALPTADPVNAGQLWNDGGTLKVSAG